jgi:phage RecT family recombinase
MSEQKSLVEVIEQTRERFVSVAPQYMNFEAEKGFAIQLLHNNSYLMSAANSSPASLLQAVTNVAAIGLSLNPAEKLAYLIPRNVKVGDKQWQTRIFLEPSYMGLCKLATDTGSIEWVQANCVYSNDEFEDNGFGNRPTHKYKPFAKLEDRGEFVGVYCTAKTKTGDFLTTIMTADEVNSIKERSESGKKNSGPWVTDFNEQAKKTVVRRGFKMWPRTDLNKLALAVEMSNENEGFEGLVSSPTIAGHNAEQKTYFDQLIEKNDAIGLYVFMTSLSDSVQSSLYNSFAKGDITKYKRLVSSLNKTGFDQFTACVDAIIDSHKESDGFAALEILEGLSQDAVSLIKERTGLEVSAFIDDVLKQEKAA